MRGEQCAGGRAHWSPSMTDPDTSAGAPWHWSNGVNRFQLINMNNTGLNSLSALESLVSVCQKKIIIIIYPHQPYRSFSALDHTVKQLDECLPGMNHIVIGRRIFFFSCFRR